MNVPILERYPFDVTGEATTNRVEGELHIIPPGNKDKVFALREGAAFSKHIKLRHADGTDLIPWRDYQPVFLYPEATEAVGEACTGLVMILNESITGYLYADYQVVGAQYGHNSRTVEDLLWAVITDERPVFWEDIVNRPSQFPPSYHTHDIFNDTYGWDERITWVDQFTQNVLEQADSDKTTSVLHYIDHLETFLTNSYNQAIDLINKHAATADVHADSKAAVGLPLLDNIATATVDQARMGDRYDLRLTVSGAEAILTDALNDYSANLMKQGILPVSRWGNLTYLEPGVAGSFEGSSGFSTVDGRPMVLEVDGTMVRLRPGSNGTSLGVYYDYMLNAFADPGSATLVKTNTQYWPAAMGREYKPFQMRKSTPDVLVGYAYRVADFPLLSQRMFIAITGESFDSTKHDVAFVNDTYTHSEYGTRTLTDRACFTIVDNYVYCVDYCPWGVSRKVGFVILRVPVSAVKANTDVTWEFLTNWTASGGIGGVMTGDSINMAYKEASVNAADNPMILMDPDMTATLYRSSWMFFIASDSPGVLKIAMGGLMHYYTTQQLNTQPIGFRCLVNVNNRTASWVDAPKQIRVRIGPGGLKDPRIDYNSAFELNQRKLNCAARNNDGNVGDEHGLTYINRFTGYYMKSYITNIINVDTLWEIGRIKNFTTFANAWDIVNRDIEMIRLSADEATFGSPVKNSLNTPLGLPNGQVLVKVQNEQNKVAFSRAQWGSPTGRNFTYNLLNLGPIKGYPPSSNRFDMPTLTYNRFRYISYLYNGTLVNWGSILTPFESSAPVNIDANGAYSSTSEIIWDVNELLNAANTFARTTEVGPSLIDAYCDIFVPQDPALPLLAIVSVRYSTAAGASHRYYMTKVNYNGPRTGNITGYSLSPAQFQMVENLTNNSNGRYDGRRKQPGLCISRIGNQLQCIVGSGVVSAVPGGLGSSMLLFSYNLDTGQGVKNATQDAIGTNPWDGGIGWHPLCVEGEGLCLAQADMEASALGTVLLAKPCGSTMAAWNSLDLTDRSDVFVLLSQQVEAGWNIYFTEEVPVILNGREGVAPITSINLTSVKANPANTTFYVYVVENNGAMSYRIAAVEEQPTINKMFIGTIVTTGSAVGNIQLSKRSRIGIYQISDTKTGSSIPVSTGLPFQAGDWSWDNK